MSKNQVKKTEVVVSPLTIEKINDFSLKLTFEKNQFFATSFCEERISRLKDQLHMAPSDEIRRVLGNWYRSKKVNFWAEFDLETLLFAPVLR